MRIAALTLAATLAFAGAAQAEVVDKSPAGFEVRETATIAATSDRVYQALTAEIGRWWSSEHTFSGDARNLTIDPARGCLCETLPGGGQVRHMTVVFADGHGLRLFGGLGPLQSTGAAGHLGFALKAAGAATDLTVTYDVGGYAKGGLAEAWAAPVDAVLGEQVARLKKYVETGKAQ
jgi:hypothetical protein